MRRVTAELNRLGWGCHQRLLASTFTDRTPALGVNLARDKAISARLLRQLGMPGAENTAVKDADQAVAAAQQLGYPVVVKPTDLDRGQGVADIGQSWTTQAALICEVNAQPQTDPKTMASIVDEVMGGSDGRIPVYLLLLGRTAVAPTEPQIIELMARLQVPDLASGAGIWVLGQRVAATPMDAWHAVSAVFGSLHASKLALVMRLDEVHLLGLPVDRLTGWAAAPDMPALLTLLGHPQVPATTMAHGLRSMAPDVPWHADDLVILNQLAHLVGPHLVAGDAQG